MLSKDIGIDLGSTNLIIYIKDIGIILNEPSLVAINDEDNIIVAVGKKAYKMLGKTSKNIKVISPIKNGIITNVELTSAMIEKFINNLDYKKSFFKPRILVGSKPNITAVEKNAIIETFDRIGIRKLYIENEGKLAALGMGMNIEENTANMIIDIGGGITSFTVLSLNNIVVSDNVSISGKKFNDDIIKYIREKYKLLIGEKTAEKIKCEFSNCYNASQKKKYKIKGRNLITGIPKEIEITEKDTEDALKDSTEYLIDEIKKILKKIPPELSSDIVDKGAVITGGCSLLKGLQEKLTKELKIPILISQSPNENVIEGTKILLKDVKKLNRIV